MNSLIKIYKIFNLKEKKKFRFLFYISIFSMLLETLSISMFIPLLQIVLSENNSNFIFTFLEKNKDFILFNNLSYVYLLLIIILSVFFVKTILMIYFTYFKNSFVQNIRASVSSSLFKNLAYSDYDYFLNTNSSIIINYLSREVDEFISMLDSGITFFTETVIIFGLLVFVIFFEPLSIYAIVFFATFSILIFVLTKKKILIWGAKRQYHDSLRAVSINEIVDGIKEIKLSKKENFFLNKFNIHSFASAEIAKKITTVVQIPRIILEFMGVVAIIILIVSLKSYGISNDETLVVVGILGAISFRVLPSLNRILNTGQALRYGKPVIDLIYSLIVEKDSTKFQNLKQEKKIDFSNFKKIQIRNINFEYKSKNQKIISNLNLDINRGEMIGIIGKTGGGKTTLLNIICGIIPPDSGEIIVDQKNVNKNIDDWQKIIAYVPQNTFLIDDTIKNNIALGIEEKFIDNSKIMKILKQANLSNFVESLSENIETKIGERGIQLSGGQKQRLGIARALYLDSKILILDEITSSLDEGTGKDIINEIRNLVPEKTIIIVSHKITSLKFCKDVYEFTKSNLTRISNDKFNI